VVPVLGGRQNQLARVPDAGDGLGQLDDGPGDGPGEQDEDARDQDNGRERNDEDYVHLLVAGTEGELAFVHVGHAGHDLGQAVFGILIEYRRVGHEKGLEFAHALLGRIGPVDDAALAFAHLADHLPIIFVLGFGPEGRLHAASAQGAGIAGSDQIGGEFELGLFQVFGLEQGPAFGVEQKAVADFGTAFVAVDGGFGGIIQGQDVAQVPGADAEQVDAEDLAGGIGARGDQAEHLGGFDQFRARARGQVVVEVHDVAEQRLPWGHVPALLQEFEGRGPDVLDVLGRHARHMVAHGGEKYVFPAFQVEIAEFAVGHGAQFVEPLQIGGHGRRGRRLGREEQ
jgi:hypothetical protein